MKIVVWSLSSKSAACCWNTGEALSQENVGSGKWNVVLAFLLRHSTGKKQVREGKTLLQLMLPGHSQSLKEVKNSSRNHGQFLLINAQLLSSIAKAYSRGTSAAHSGRGSPTSIPTQDNIFQVCLWANPSRVVLSSQVTWSCVNLIINVNQDTQDMNIKPWGKHSGDETLKSAPAGKAAVLL